MAILKCCGFDRKPRSYVIDPEDGYIYSTLNFLERCNICTSAIAEVSSLDLDHEISTYRKTGKKALKLMEKLKSSIIYEDTDGIKPNLSGSRSYLRYNDYGSIKKCYSSLSCLQLGLFESLEPSFFKDKLKFIS